MGKASKWLKKFLLRKKEDEVVPTVTCAGSSTAILPPTPRVRRRWSFSGSKGKEIFQHKLCKSLAAMDASILPVELMIEDAKTRYISPRVVLTDPRYDFWDKAATKIQAVFRAFLARKALYALRGLVKIQALVRGHLVRKQTTITLRCMHALIKIQVRARVQRIKISKEENVSSRQSLKHHRFPQDGVSNNENIYEHGHHRPTFYPSNSMVKSLATHGSLRHCPSKTIGHSAFYTAKYANKMANEEQPSYMCTKSSKAKGRAQSEPKQRPNSGAGEKGRKSVTIEGTGVNQCTGKISAKLYEPHLRLN